MSWQALMLLQNLLAAFYVINARVIAKRYRAATMPLNLVVYLFVAVGGLVYSLISDPGRISPPAAWHFGGLLLATGLMIAATNMLLYIVFEYVDAAVATLLSSLNIIAAVVASSLILHEDLGWQQILGGLVLLLSVQLVLMLHFGKHQRRNLWLAVGLTVAASILFGTAMTSEKYLLNQLPLQTYLSFGWGMQLVGAILLAAGFARIIKVDFSLFRQKSFPVLVSSVGLLRVTGGLAYIMSLKWSNNLSVISVLTGLKVVMAACLSIYLLKERDFVGRKLTAALIAAIGMAIIYWR